MLFVRSVDGISHAPEERTSPEDIALCVEALAAALGRLAA
jgi:acetylornithine deacetylase/succinyl-diaminopimelate desuccinylase-like protein